MRLIDADSIEAFLRARRNVLKSEGKPTLIDLLEIEKVEYALAVVMLSVTVEGDNNVD